MSLINVAEITEALYAQLKADAATAALFNTIARGTYVNQDANATPWIGVYRAKVEYDPATLGTRISQWRARVKLRLVIQATSIIGGDVAQDAIEAAAATALDAVFADKTLGGAVDMLVGMDTTYSYQESEQETMLFQQMDVELEFEVRTS